MKDFPTVREAERIRDSLELLYEKFLCEAAKIVEKRIVIIFPVLKTKERTLVGCRVDALLQRCGLRVASLSPLVRLPVEYAYPESKLKRLVYVLKRYR